MLQKAKDFTRQLRPGSSRSRNRQRIEHESIDNSDREGTKLTRSSVERQNAGRPDQTISTPINSRSSSTRVAIIEGVKRAVVLIEKASDTIPPVKSAAAVVNQIVTVVDKTSANMDDLQDLEGKLSNLAEHLERMKGRGLSESLRFRSEVFLKNLSKLKDKIYTLEDRSLARRLMESDKDVLLVEAVFRDMGHEINKFQMDTMATVEIATARIESSVIDLRNNEFLKQLKPDHLEDKVERRPCMDGTRLDILRQVNEWINDATAPTIFWICGYPGTGKSALARSIVDSLWPLRRFGSAFYFERDNARQKSTANLWRQVAFDLSTQIPQYGASVINVLKAGHFDMSKISGNQIFRRIVEEPLVAMKGLQTASAALPVVVIDALDECGGLEGSRSEDRRELLNHLCRWAELGIKVVVTSRDEEDILRQLSQKCHKIYLSTGEDEKDSPDICLYLTESFRSISASNRFLASENWPGDAKIRHLTQRASGLFIWATTAVRIVEDGNPAEQLESLEQIGGNVFGLYRQILVSAFKEEPPDSVVSSLKAFCGALILTKQPLGFEDLVALLGIRPDSLEYIRSKLRPVLDNNRNTIRFSHQSFVDFLCNSSCPKSFAFEKGKRAQQIVLGSLQLLSRTLRFNICNFPSSYLTNKDIDDLPRRMREASVTSAVRYSCQFWASHIEESPYSTNLLSCVDNFLAKYFLFWLELSSLLDIVSAVGSSLRRLEQWVQEKNTDVVVRLKDARRFVSAFGTIISQSAPQIYLSALPFSPSQSWTRFNFLDQFLRAIKVETGQHKTWSAQEICIEGHTDEVTSVAFSHDSRRVASGSYDKTVRIWDAETGELVSGPFVGHTDWVWSVAISHDSRRVVSGSYDKTVRIWDAETGELVLGPLRGHGSSLRSVAFSNDSRMVVSGSDDKTVRVWDAETGELVSGPFEGHKDGVNSVAFSHDSTRVVSGSGDKTIRIWDAASGELVSEPFDGHFGAVNSVAFSHDSKQIVSGSSDETIRVWDAKTGALVSGPLKGHNSAVYSVAFSHDGTKLASGSSDSAVRVWDAKTGALISGPFEGHTDWVWSVAFSCHGRRVVSGSNDGTVRIWDVATDKLVSRPCKGHTDWVRSVAFSHDSRMVVSGSDDRTIRIWDVGTGELASRPFEGHTGRVWSVTFSYDNKRIASGSDDHTVRIWDVQTGQLVLGPLGHRDAVYSVAFSHDSKKVASGSFDETVRVWDAETGKLVSGPFEGHSGAVNSVAFSHDSSKLVSGSIDSTVRVWDSETGALISGPFEGHIDAIYSVAFSHDSKKVVSGSSDETVRVWDVETGVMVSGPFEGHAYWVRSVAFSHDSRRVVSGSDDKTIRVWDAETGQPVSGPFEGHTGEVNSVAFSRDSKKVVSGSDDKTVRIWDGDVDQYLFRRGNGKVDTSHQDVTAEELRQCCTFLQYSPNSNHWLHVEASNSPELFCSTRSIADDGWATLPSTGDRLFWVPKEYRTWLFTRGTRQILPSEKSVTLDLSKFVHGPDWYRCYDPAGGNR